MRPSGWVSICSRATLTKCPERSGLEEERALVLAGDGRHGWQEVAQTALDFVNRFVPAKPS
jgi:hypothetical protein